jgi:hypothetical protein
MGAFYRARLSEFLAHTSLQIVVSLSSAYQHTDLKRRQIKAWEQEISVLKSAFTELTRSTASAREWFVLLEYPIPRRQKRLDTVVLAGNVIICLEFKTRDKGKENDRPYYLAAQRQVEEYALDLRDFHEASHGRPIVPIVVFPKDFDLTDSSTPGSSDLVRFVRTASVGNLGKIILAAFQADLQGDCPQVDGELWDRSAYRPVPTIIEAAEALYAGHNVREITHSHAGLTNLTTTSDYLVQVIETAQHKGEKVVAFVTGVPGAGKTLAGLNIIHNPALRKAGRPAGVFLSGNGPLVKIVSAAIARDHRRRSQERGGDRTVRTFIQNVHVFVGEGLDKPDYPPVEHIVVFDEAQRAWNAEQNLKKNELDASEPETLLSIMDRHKAWAVVVALVGGGQEIHNGEAGLAEWGKTLREKFPHWRVVVSPKAIDRDASVAGHRLFQDGDSGSLKIETEPSLHLEVCQRSFRARKVTEWVDATLSVEPEKAAAIVGKLSDFPIVCTRSLPNTREWLRNQTRGRRRCGSRQFRSHTPSSRRP